MEERLWWDYGLLILICTLGFGAIVSLIQHKSGEPLKRIVLSPYLFPASCSQCLLALAKAFLWPPRALEQTTCATENLFSN